MKKSRVRNLTKQIIFIIVILMLCNFIIPPTTYAISEDGGVLFNPFAKFITYLCDSIMQFLQECFTSRENISQPFGIYNFQYSPAIIFSGTVQGLDINFIEPNEDIRSMYNFDVFINNNKAVYMYAVLSDDKYKCEKSEYEDCITFAKNKNDITIISQTLRPSQMVDVEENNYISSDIIYYIEDNVLVIEVFVIDNDSSNKTHYYNKYTQELDETMMEYKITYESIAHQLQPIIATWYNALKRIALVGLLSVLVYVGIKIVLSSSNAKEASKYKKMLVDWLIALCLLFTIHYIMSITVTITGYISKIFNTGDTDPLLNTIRGDIKQSNNWKEVAALVVMYVAMTIYTIIFTFQYLKRVLHMGVLTIIAPLVTLTYPLDKIKDGKAQAFNMWIREYIFNSLIQVVHLLVYYILVGSAITLASTYRLYAIVAIGFITQGERIIRKMFGFDNATSIGTLGAVATGGLVTSAMNKLSSMTKSAKKESNSSETANNKVRTASNNSLASLNGGASEGNIHSNNGNWVNGAGAVAGKYGKKVIKGAGKGLIKASGGATGAMIGFASGVAQGDVSAALAGAVAGRKAGSDLAGAGINAAKNIPGGIKNTANDLRDTWNTGAYGDEYAQEQKK